MKRSKERDRESEKAMMPDKREAICPLIFKLVHLAVNYDLTWQPETKITVTDNEGSVIREVTGVWKSNPVIRGHTEAFRRELQRMREAEEISWVESAYYFTHEEGIAARKTYETEVLKGRIKAHLGSWGPNPKKANDKSRFHKFTGVGFDELKEKYPELYSKSTATASHSDEAKAVTVDTPEAKEVVQEEPSGSELEAIEEEAKVAAAAAPEATIEDLAAELESENERDDHNLIPLYVPADIQAERIDTSHESIAWTDEDGVQRQAYLMPLPEIGTEMWLEAGPHLISNQRYEVRVED